LFGHFEAGGKLDLHGETPVTLTAATFVFMLRISVGSHSTGPHSSAALRDRCPMRAAPTQFLCGNRVLRPASSTRKRCAVVELIGRFISRRPLHVHRAREMLSDMDQPTGNAAVPTAMRILFGVFGFVFAGIGVAVLIFMWTAGGFGEPPLFFRVFASFIALAFVAFGGTLGYSAVRPQAMSPTPPPQAHEPAPASSAGYTCHNCGATLGKDADVSPLGDVKCTFCGRWFNIHRRD
jgi:hypothetical protein